MEIVFEHAMVVTGDGKTVLEDTSIVIEDSIIRDIVQGSLSSLIEGADRIIDAEGFCIIPGLINNHAHRCSMGPAGSTGDVSRTKEQVIEQLDKHLLSGETTVLNVDAFITMEENEKANKLNPLNLKKATGHMPTLIRAAEVVGEGKGLKKVHKELTVKEMLNRGAVAIGEIGGGAVLAGGATDYRILPEAIKKVTGKMLEPKEARAIKRSVLGRYVDSSAFNPVELGKLLRKYGLDAYLTVENARKLVEDTIVPSYKVGMEAYAEAGRFAREFDAPVIYHNSAPTIKAILREAKLGGRIIAGHSNHTTFELNEAIDFAKELRKYGVTIDISTLDAWGAKRLEESPEMFYSLLKEGVTDTVSTDWAGGYWDPIIIGLDMAVRENVIELPKAIATATYNVAKAIPKLAPNRGLIAKGKIADIVMTNKEKLSEIDTVVVSGKIVVEKGKIVH